MLDFQKDCGLKLIRDLVKSDETLSRIYGFILYTEKDPYVAKVLQDDSFWNALDAISGTTWPIFAARPLKEGHSELRGGGIPGTMSMMVSVWEEPKSNYPILEYFDLDSSEKMPVFIAFIWDDNDELNQVAVPIRGNTMDDVYASLREIVKVISKVENDIKSENKQSVQVFRNVKMELEALNWKYNAKQKVKFVIKILDFLRFFR